MSATDLSRRRMRVVIVQDNRAAADSLGHLLGLDGYDVRVAYTGPEGVRLAQEWPPDVVLCDLGLPGPDGYEVARQIRRQPGRRPVVIGIGNDCRAVDILKAREAGCDHFFAKPADPDTLRPVLRAVQDGLPLSP
jgi:CheY-like chemotaxis protein